MINITLPDGSVKQFEKGVSGYEIARNISEGLARNAISIVANGKTIELMRPIEEDANIKICTWNDPEGKSYILAFFRSLNGRSYRNSLSGRKIWNRS